MKSNIKIVLFTLVFLFLFSSMFKTFSNEEINHIQYYNENPNQLEQSGSWNLTGTPILIDNNWTAVKATHEWCTGEGTESEPYIIENVTIDAQYSGSCIEIQNSNDYFIIQNCSLYNSGSTHDAGIILNNVTNGKIINNYCYSNLYGIRLYKSNYNMVSDNTASNNSHGLWLSQSDENTVSDNNASNNIAYGIYMSGSDNIVSRNTVSYNGFNGMYISDGNYNTVSGNNVSYNNEGGIQIYLGNYNTVSGNTANNNNYDGIALYSNYNMVSGNTANNNNIDGIYLMVSDGNTISDNTANDNYYYGIHLDESDGNTISDNTVNDNYYGIYLSQSGDNIVFLNIFTNNTLNAKDDGNNNMWNFGFIGNYWDDYQGVDANNDGRGDTPYSITGSAGSQDRYPIWNNGDQPSIPFGNYFLLFTIIAILSLTILEKQKKKCHPC